MKPRSKLGTRPNLHAMLADGVRAAATINNDNNKSN
jgi:hypothetical protein